ncbi:MAG: MFS transporter, partial [Cyclobacteriaceae bacterium]
ALGVSGDIVAGDAVMYSYLALAIGDFGSGFISQMVQSRKKIVLIFILLTLGSILLYLFMPITTVTFFYIACGILGFSIGYWALFVTIAAEQFGTNLRSTVATTVPNFIRGTVVPITLAFKFLRGEMGIINGALIVGVVTIIIALIALTTIDETFSRDMNYLEEK